MEDIIYFYLSAFNFSKLLFSFPIEAFFGFSIEPTKYLSGNLLSGNLLSENLCTHMTNKVHGWLTGRLDLQKMT
jgi:hypothetical protein